MSEAPGNEIPSAFSHEVNRSRWNSHIFEFEKLAAVFHAQGLRFKDYIEVATMAWGITGQTIQTVWPDDSKEQQQ